MTLHLFKDTYAKNRGFEDWENYILFQFRFKGIVEIEIEYNNIAIDFAKLQVKEALEKRETYCYNKCKNIADVNIESKEIFNPLPLDNIQ